MREFNTTGPCNPALHYTVMREELLATGKEKVRKGQYFTIFAPRQSGKTTYLKLLLAELKDEGFISIWISFESFSTLSKQRFYQALTQELHHSLAEYEVMISQSIKDSFDLVTFFQSVQDKPIVLVIDEFEGIPDEVLSRVICNWQKYDVKNLDFR